MSDAEVEMAFSRKHAEPAPLPETVFVIDAQITANQERIDALRDLRPTWDRDKSLKRLRDRQDELLERRLKLTDVALSKALEKEF